MIPENIVEKASLIEFASRNPASMMFANEVKNSQSPILVHDVFVLDEHVSVHMFLSRAQLYCPCNY